jgi:hypothetical protein
MVVMTAPVMVPPVAEVADAMRTVVGPDDAAAAVRVVIGVVIIIRVVGRSVEERPVKVMPMVGEANAPAMDDRSATKRAAMECCATAVECRAAGMEPATATAVTTSTSSTSSSTSTSSTTAAMTTATAAAMATADFGRQRSGGGLRDRRCAGIDQRHRLT